MTRRSIALPQPLCCSQRNRRRVGLLEKATGNVGWALYKLGDYRRALANSQASPEQQEAGALGVPIDQSAWLNDAGLSQARLGDLNAAKTSYEHSLQLARSLRNSEEISDALVALSSLSLQMGNLDDALERSREAQQIAQQRGNDTDTLRPALIEALVLEKQGKTSAAKDQLVSLQQRSSSRLSGSLGGGECPRPGSQWRVPGDRGFGRRMVSPCDRDVFRSQRCHRSPSIESRLPFVENRKPALYRSYMACTSSRPSPWKGRLRTRSNILDQGRAGDPRGGGGPGSSARA